MMQPGNPRTPPRADCQMRIKTRSDTESFLVCHMETRNQLGMPQEIPILL